MGSRAPKSIFVAMPFQDSYESVLETIKDAARLLNVRVVQVGEEPIVGSIISHIRDEIEKADAMVAVVSEVNGNVYYEIGLAHSQAKPVILLTSDIDALRFDLRDHRAIVYDPAQPKAIRDELVQSIRAVLESTSDPHQYLAETYSGTSIQAQEASKKGLDKAVATIAVQAGLHSPVLVKQYHVREDFRDLAIEVEDFMGTKVRAIVDVNGFVKVMRHLERK